MLARTVDAIAERGEGLLLLLGRLAIGALATAALSYCAVGWGLEGGDSNRGGGACLIKSDDQVILKIPRT